MKENSVGIYYNCDYGYIIVSYTTLKGSILRKVINPVIAKTIDVSDSELGEMFLEALLKSKTATPVEKKESFKFWEISGIKGYNSFSKKFRLIKIIQVNDDYKIGEFKKESDGGYSEPYNYHLITIALDSLAEQLGKEVRKLLEDETVSNDNKTLSFDTLNDSTVKYERPSDDFLDIGDGHTDAYQIYTYEENEKNYIAFIIDSGYSNFDEKSIKERWKQMYEDLIMFEYREVNEKSLNIQIRGKTKTQSIVSNIYKDRNGMLEVITEINTQNIHIDVQRKIELEFKKVIESICIEG